MEKLDFTVYSNSSKFKEGVCYQLMKDLVLTRNVKNVSEKTNQSESILNDMWEVGVENKSHPLKDSAVIEDVKDS